MTESAARPQEGQTIPHHKLVDAAGVVIGGTGSRVFHLDDLPELSSEHDGRKKKVLLNTPSTGSEMLVDILDYAPGGTSPLHYHKGTEHFFFVLGGRGRIVINDREHLLRPNTVVWIVDGDVHKVYADPDSRLQFLEYFSKGRHETVFMEEACAWTPPSKM